MMDTCELCGKVREGKKRFINHHLRYFNRDGTGTEVFAFLCYTCHSLLHGSARIYNHPFHELGKALAPLEFAKRVVTLYKKRGIK